MDLTCLTSSDRFPIVCISSRVSSGTMLTLMRGDDGNLEGEGIRKLQSMAFDESLST